MNSVGVILSLFLLFLTPAIILFLFVYRGGFSTGLDLNGIWQMATSNTTNTLLPSPSLQRVPPSSGGSG